MPEGKIWVKAARNFEMMFVASTGVKGAQLVSSVLLHLRVLMISPALRYPHLPVPMYLSTKVFTLRDTKFSTDHYPLR